MPDGRLVLYYGRPGQSVMVSDDGNGASWSPPTAVDYRNSANGSAVPLTPTRSSSSATEAPTGPFNKPPTASVWSRTINLGTR